MNDQFLEWEKMNTAETMTIGIKFNERLPDKSSYERSYYAIMATQQYLQKSGISPDKDGYYHICVYKNIYPDSDIVDDHGSGYREKRGKVRITVTVKPDRFPPNVADTKNPEPDIWMKLDPFGEALGMSPVMMMPISQLDSIKLSYGGEVSQAFDPSSGKIISGKEIPV